MKTLKTAFAAAIMSLPLCAHASDEITLQDRIPPELLTEDNSFFTLTVENDMFGGGTDQNYTSGVRLTYFNDFNTTPEFVETIAQNIPFFDANNTTSAYYSFGQNLYTPEDIKTPAPDTNDRPYAAFLYGSIGYTTLSEDHIDDIEITLGVVGPSAIGKNTQKFVHKIVDSPDPKGWEHQLKDELGVILAFQRSWPTAYEAVFSPFYFRVAPHAGVSLGNVYTYAATGVTFQLVPEEHRWQAPPARVRPAIPGSGYFAIPNDEFSWSLFAGFEGRAVARNIFLDGNTFEDSRSVDKKFAVLDANTGFTATYGRSQVAFTLNWRSEEFRTQKDHSLFGSMSLGYRF
jgi:lipid A 3-O-deacylase